MPSKSIVAVARNAAYSADSVSKALQNVFDNLARPLPALVKRGDRVLVKVNMGCSGARFPDDRRTTHPLVAEAIIGSLLDCGAIVSFGDDVARAGKHCEHIWKATGMWEVAQRTGAALVDFVSAGAREVRGSLLYPRSYLITNLYFESDVIINAASCRSHAHVGLSGTIKNMFGMVVGTRKLLIHNLFGWDPRKFARAIVDIHRAVRADLSILDLTTVLQGHGAEEAVCPVGLLFASTDPVALDSLAAHVIGYDDLPIWTTYYGEKLGLGCNDLAQIDIRGLAWKSFETCRLKYPLLPPIVKLPVRDRMKRFANHTFLRPRPVISAIQCTGCGDCAGRCPVNCIERVSDSLFRIDLDRCVDCDCCIKVCEQGAARLEHVGFARMLRRLAGRLPAASSA